MNNINFSVKIVHASAGTGKTQLLTDEFIDYLKKEKIVNSVKRVVAITFSEKAACEMRSRIIEKIFQQIISNLPDEKTKIDYENQLFLLRVSTIHSFCKTLLKRFSFLFQFDPNFTVAEPEQEMIFFRQAIFQFLERCSFDDEILQRLKPMKLKQFIDYLGLLNNTHPQVFLGRPYEDELTQPVYDCFLEVKKIFENIKKQNSVVDFDDLEIFTYQLLKEHPQALNILNDFDEAVDFIFVDEFQDTSLLQWKIISEFSSEWVSGLGAKAETGKKYGLFFVGDRKQSIYFFRGAENTVFDDAENYYGHYLQKKFLTTNYRSFPVIIDFVNEVFNNVDGFPEEEKLSVSEKLADKKDGFVEIKIFEQSKIAEEKQAEYGWVARRILSLIEEKFPVYDRDTDEFHSVSFKDIAVLLRKRTHLNILEEQFRYFGIPFVNIGGIGFYQEPEIVFLINLLCCLADPSDITAFKNIIQSNFGIDAEKIEKWRKLFSSEFPASAIDKILGELDLFSKIGTQGSANVEKFLMLVHEMRNMPFFQLVQNLKRFSYKDEEPKADVFSERQNAVRVLTVHASKGLEFPVVFITGIEQGKPDKSKIKLIHERIISNDSDYVFGFKKEKDDQYYTNYLKKLEQEEKRILYVALTRATQVLVITGAKNKSTWLELIQQLEKKYPAKDFKISEKIPCFSAEAGENVKKLEINRKFITPVSFSSLKQEIVASGEKEGTIIHKIINEISTGKLEPEKKKMEERVMFLAKKMKVIINKDEIETHIENLLKPEILKIILPQPSSYSELPFLSVVDGKNVYGVIDRVIIENGICRIYDFKTGKRTKISDNDILQIDLYKSAVRNLFNVKKTEQFIIFTFQGIIKQVQV